MMQQADAERALSGVITETDRGPVITFTIEDQDLVMTVDEVGKITSTEFQRLYSVGHALLLHRSKTTYFANSLNSLNSLNNPSSKSAQYLGLTSCACVYLLVYLLHLWTLAQCVAATHIAEHFKSNAGQHLTCKTA